MDEKRKLLKMLVALILAQNKPIPPELSEIAEEIKKEREKWAGVTTQHGRKSDVR